MNQTEVKKLKTETAIKWVGGVGLVLVVGGIAVAVLTSVVAIASAAIAGLVAVNALPVVARKLASWRVNALTHDAVVNPIPNLISQYERDQAAVRKHREAVIGFSGTIKNFKTKIDHFAQKGSSGVEDMRVMYENMKRALLFQMNALQTAINDLNQFQEDISKAQDEWQIALELKKANEAMAVFTDVDPLQDMLRRTSFDAIQSKLNNSRAALEVSMTLDYRSLPQEVRDVQVVSIDDLSNRLKTLEV